MKHDITVTSPLWKDVLSVIVGFFFMVRQVICGIAEMIAGVFLFIISGGCITLLIAFVVILLILAAGN